MGLTTKFYKTLPTDEKVYKTFSDDCKIIIFLLIIIMIMVPINYELERKAAAVANVVVNKVKGWLNKK